MKGRFRNDCMASMIPLSGSFSVRIAHTKVLALRNGVSYIGTMVLVGMIICWKTVVLTMSRDTF